MSIAKPQTTSLVDTITQGFAAVNRRWWLVALPILLNLAIWYGAQISFQPMVNTLVTALQRTTPADQRDTTDIIFESWRTVGQADLTQAFDRMRFTPRLTVYTLAPANSANLPLPSEVLPQIDPNRVWLTVGSTSTALLLMLVVNALLIPLGAVFLALIANAVRSKPLSAAWLQSLGRTVASILGYAALVLAAFALAVAPIALITLLLLAAVPPIGGTLLLLLLIGLFWLGVYIGFVPEIIALAGLDPVAALRASVALVRRSFWATLGLLLLLYVISIGLGVVWGVLVPSSLGLLVAVFGSAYVGSGLAAARMLFVQQRIGKS